MAGSKETALIIRIRQDQDLLRKDFAKTRAMMNKQRSQMQMIGKQISATLAASFGVYAIAAGVGRAVKSIASLEMEMSKVKAVSGASAEQFKSLQKNALDLGRTTKFTATEIATLQSELSKLGFSPAKILASTDAIRKLATVAGADLGESAKSMAGSLNSFNLSATESERVANVMAEAFTKSGLDLEKFTVATANSGAIASAFGVTIEENTARLGALVDANIDASKAGTDMRMIYLQLNEAGLTYQEGMDIITKSTNKLSTARKLFDVRAAGSAVILARQQEKVNELTKSLSDNNKELDTMVGIMEDNLITDWDKFTSAIDGAIQRGGGMIDVLRGMTQAMSGFVNGLGTTDLDSQFKKAGIDVGITGPSSEDMWALVQFNEELKKSVDYTKRMILTGEDIFDDVAISSLKAEDQVAELEKRLISLVDHQFYDDLKKEVDLYKDSLKQLIAAEKEAEDQARRLRKEQEKRARAGKASDMLSGINGVGAPDIGGGVVNPDMSIPQEAFDSALKKNKENWAKYRASIVTEVDILNQEISGIMERMMEQAVIAMAQALGSGASLKDLLGGLMSILGAGLQQIGEALIAYGVAMGAFKEAFINPWAAIAAGFVLVAAGAALGSAVQNMNSSASSASGSGGSSRSGPSGNFQYDRRSQTINITGELVGNGKELKAVFDTQQSFDNRNVG